MKELIIVLSALSVMFILLHELDACQKSEWRMFRFLNNLKEEVQYLVFLYAHIPIILFLFYYMWTVISFNNIYLWIIVNAILIIHLLVHIIARKWKSNVFKSMNSFILIAGAAVTGLVNLLLFRFY